MKKLSLYLNTLIEFYELLIKIYLTFKSFNFLGSEILELNRNLNDTKSTLGKQLLSPSVGPHYTGWPRSYRKYMLQITQSSQYKYAKLQYRFAVTQYLRMRYNKDSTVCKDIIDCWVLSTLG